MAKTNLTESVGDTVQAQTKNVELRDTAMPDFLCKITPAGRKLFMPQYHTEAGEHRKPALGLYGELLSIRPVQRCRSGWPIRARAMGLTRPRTPPTRQPKAPHLLLHL